jgi:hypothetical protein
VGEAACIAVDVSGVDEAQTVKIGVLCDCHDGAVICNYHGERKRNKAIIPEMLNRINFHHHGSESCMSHFWKREAYNNPFELL